MDLGIIVLSDISDMEKVAEDLDSIGEAVDVIYLNSQKSFGKVPHLWLIANLEEIGVRGRELEWIEKWLQGQKAMCCD